MKVALVVLVAVALAVVILLATRSKRAASESADSKGEAARRVAELVAPLRRPAVLLRKTGERSRSCVGGLPPAYPGFVWPSKDGRPLGFLACIDLAEIGSIEWLPREGLLLFFYDLEEQPWGFDPADRGGWAVLHVPDPLVAGEADFPSGFKDEWKVPRHAIAFTPRSIAPSWDHEAALALGLSDEEADALIDLRGTEYGDDPRHQMGGYADPIQGAEMELECQLASHGASGQNDPRAKALAKGAADWRLLLQMDSDDDLGVMWGDAGMLYFWVREEEARRGDFTGVWLVLQCY